MTSPSLNAVKATQCQSAASDPNSVTDTYLEHYGTRAPGCPGHANLNTHILITNRKFAGRPKISNVTCN